MQLIHASQPRDTQHSSKPAFYFSPVGDTALLRANVAPEMQADILEHREEQIRGSEARASSLQQEVERLAAEIQHCNEELAKLKVNG